MVSQYLKTIQALALGILVFLVIMATSVINHQPEFNETSTGTYSEQTNHYMMKEFAQVTEYLPANILTTLSKRALTEVKCIALNNYYEAATEGINGMKAVSQVVLNRMDEVGFPSTACGVIYQKNSLVCQFSWTCQKKALPKLDYESNAWKNAVIAAKQVYLDKQTVRGLEDALFYHATYVNPKWKRVQKVGKVGTHIFYAKKKSPTSKA